MEAHAAFNVVDYAVFALILISGLLAIFSGFVSEMYSLFNWSASAYLGAHYYRFAEPYVAKYIGNPTVVMYVSIFAVFCVTFIILSLIGSIIERAISGTTLTAINRSLGFVFGLGRGLFLVCLLYLIVSILMWPDLLKPQTKPNLNETPTAAANDDATRKDKPEEAKEHSKAEPPELLLQARTRPLLAHGAFMLREFIPDNVLEKATTSYLDKRRSVHDKVEESIINKDDRNSIAEHEKE